MTVLITGASGMLGRYLLLEFNGNGITCLASSRSKPDFLPKNTSWQYWDLCEWKTSEQLDSMFPSIEYIVHAGAPVPKTPGSIELSHNFDASVRATLCLATWAKLRGLPMIYISGAIVYDEPERSNILETDTLGCWEPWSDYCLSKILSERVLKLQEKTGLMLCILRPSSIYGIGLAKNKIIPQFLHTSSKGHLIELQPPDGDRINLVHAEDVAHATFTVFEKRHTGIYNIAAENLTTIKNIALACIDAVGSGEVITKNNKEEIDCNITSRFDLNIESARVSLGFKPKYDIYSGIAKVWEDMNTRVV